MDFFSASIRIFPRSPGFVGFRSETTVSGICLSLTTLRWNRSSVHVTENAVANAYFIVVVFSLCLITKNSIGQIYLYDFGMSIGIIGIDVWMVLKQVRLNVSYNAH